MNVYNIFYVKNKNNVFDHKVEGGMIDWAHHSGLGNVALDEGRAFDLAIQTALDMVDTEVKII